jgi:hypothetical protein
MGMASMKGMLVCNDPHGESAAASSVSLVYSDSVLSGILFSAIVSASLCYGYARRLKPLESVAKLDVRPPLVRHARSGAPLRVPRTAVGGGATILLGTALATGISARIFAFLTVEDEAIARYPAKPSIMPQPAYRMLMGLGVSASGTFDALPKDEIRASCDALQQQLAAVFDFDPTNPYPPAYIDGFVCEVHEVKESSESSPGRNVAVLFDLWILNPLVGVSRRTNDFLDVTNMNLTIGTIGLDMPLFGIPRDEATVSLGALSYLSSPPNDLLAHTIWNFFYSPSSVSDLNPMNWTQAPIRDHCFHDTYADLVLSRLFPSQLGCAAYQGVDLVQTTFSLTTVTSGCGQASVSSNYEYTALEYSDIQTSSRLATNTSSPNVTRVEMTFALPESKLLRFSNSVCVARTVSTTHFLQTIFALFGAALAVHPVLRATLKVTRPVWIRLCCFVPYVWCFKYRFPFPDDDDAADDDDADNSPLLGTDADEDPVSFRSLHVNDDKVDEDDTNLPLIGYI